MHSMKSPGEHLVADHDCPCRRKGDERAQALQDVIDLIEDLIPLVNPEEQLLLKDVILDILLIREKP